MLNEKKSLEEGSREGQFDGEDGGHGFTSSKTVLHKKINILEKLES